MALQVGIVGCFQNGKSSLINCLLENRVAVSGNGDSTTKQIIKYCYAAKPMIYKRSGSKKTSVSIDCYLSGFLDKNVTHYEVGLPIEFLKDIELLDTPGFDANDRDDQITTDCLKELDCVIVLLGGSRGGLKAAEKAILQTIQLHQLPFAVIYNSQAVCDAQWAPHSEENRTLRHATAAEMRMKGLDGGVKIGDEMIVAVNTAWFWYSLMHDKRENMLLPANEGEKKMLSSVCIHFAYAESAPTPQTVAALSHIGRVKGFLQKNSFYFNNIHNMTALYRQVNRARTAIDAVWEKGNA